MTTRMGMMHRTPTRMSTGLSIPLSIPMSMGTGMITATATITRILHTAMSILETASGPGGRGYFARWVACWLSGWSAC